jgi:5-methylcytosine-specific restriction endonuclease McrA
MVYFDKKRKVFMEYKWIKGSCGDYIKNPRYDEEIFTEEQPIEIEEQPIETEKQPVKKEKPIKKSRHIQARALRYKTAGSSSDIPGWTKIRAQILERDSYMCRICGKDAVEAQLNVHHIDWDRSHNDLDNLVTVCHSCHKAVHTERYVPSDFEDDWPEPWGRHPLS